MIDSVIAFVKLRGDTLSARESDGMLPNSTPNPVCESKVLFLVDLPAAPQVICHLSLISNYLVCLD